MGLGVRMCMLGCHHKPEILHPLTLRLNIAPKALDNMIFGFPKQEFLEL